LTQPGAPEHTTCQIGLLLIDCHLVTSGIACKSLNFKTKTVERLNLDGQTMYLPLGLPCYVYLCGFYAFTFTFLSQSIKPSIFLAPIQDLYSVHPRPTRVYGQKKRVH